MVVPATRAHAEAIELRPGDAREVAALGLVLPAAIDLCLARALWAEAWLIDGEVAALAGLSLPSLLSDHAAPWLLTGRPVDRHRKLFLRETRAGLARMRADYPLLRNHVHADYGQAIRWLAWLGFTIGPPVPMGPHAAPFRLFEIGGKEPRP